MIDELLESHPELRRMCSVCKGPVSDGCGCESAPRGRVAATGGRDELLGEWVVRMPDTEADGLLVDKVAHEMRLKLAKKRREGRHGWHGPNCSNDKLLAMLKEHVDKGDMVDVINLAGMILCRTSLYGESA